jgi:hypothetical protein
MEFTFQVAMRIPGNLVRQALAFQPVSPLIRHLLAENKFPV